MVHYRMRYGDREPYYDDTYLISAVLDDGSGAVQQETKGDSIVEARLLAMNLIKKCIREKKYIHWAHIIKDNPQQPSDKDSNVMYDNGQFYWIPNGKYGLAVPINANGTLASGRKALMYWLYLIGKNEEGSSKVIVARGIVEARALAIARFYKRGRSISFDTAHFGAKRTATVGKMYFDENGKVSWTGKDGKKALVNPMNGRLM